MENPFASIPTRQNAVAHPTAKDKRYKRQLNSVLDVESLDFYGKRMELQTDCMNHNQQSSRFGAQFK